MIHNHNHLHKHVLEHCTHCDIVYCGSCGKEWGKVSLGALYQNTFQPFHTLKASNMRHSH